MSRYSNKLTIGYSFRKLFVKKYGVLDWTPFDGVTDYKGLIFTYEAGPRLIKSNNKRSYTPELELVDLVWVREASSPEEDMQLLVSATSVKTFGTWYRDRILQDVLAGNSYQHPFYKKCFSAGKFVGANNHMFPLAGSGTKSTSRENEGTLYSYDLFVENLYRAFDLKNLIGSKVTKYKANQKKVFDKYCKDNSLTKEQIKAFKQAEKKEIQAKINEEKFSTHLSKEMDMLSVLAVDLSTLIEECRDMQTYIANPDNRLNVRYYKSRVKKVKEAIKNIRRMKVVEK